MSFSDRLTQLIDSQYNRNKKKFSELTGIAYTSVVEYTKGVKKDPKLSLINKIQSSNINVNTLWLLTGEGSMLVEEGKPAALPAGLGDEPKAIPLVDAYAVGGFGSVDFKLEQQDVKEYYVIPKFKDRQIDFMIEVSGSSMYPKYNSGDVIACRVIHERAFIQWNHTHVVATREQGILVKRLREGEIEGSLLAVSDNQNYPPFHIPETEITGLALVVGVIRLE